MSEERMKTKEASQAEDSLTALLSRVRAAQAVWAARCLGTKGLRATV